MMDGPTPPGEVIVGHVLDRPAPGRPRLGGWLRCPRCGRRHVPCHAADAAPAKWRPRNGWCCPAGHEGYVDVGHPEGGFVARQRFAGVEVRQPGETEGQR